MKQINLIGINFKEVFKWSGWVLLFILLFFMKTYRTEPNFNKVEFPEKKGVFKGLKPIHAEISNKSNSVVVKEKVYISNPLNKQLLAENEILKDEFKIVDSINKILLYEKAIAINSFSTKFEDENLELNLSGIVRGEVQEITPSYVNKKQSIQVPNKQTIFRLLGGVEVGNTIQFDKLTFKANLGFQNKSGDVLNVGYDNQKVIWVGFSKSIFKIDK